MFTNDRIVYPLLVSAADFSALPVWFRLPLTIRCAAEPPEPQWFPFILRAILKTVCKSPFTFHQQDGAGLPVAPRIGEIYRIYVFLTNIDESLAREVAVRVAKTRFENFSVEDVGRLETRSVGGLIDELESRCAGAEEICMDFRTPFVIGSSSPGADVALSPEKILRLLEARAKHVLGRTLIPQEKFEWEARSWFLHKTKPRIRMSRSQPGHREFVQGLEGPLFLRGDHAPLLPLLALAGELHVGRALTVGSGYFQILRDVPVLDVPFADPGKWISEAARLREDPERIEIWLGPAAPDDAEIRDLCSAIRKGEFPREPAKKIAIPKSSGGTRTVGRLEPRTFLFHRMLMRVLERPIDRRLSPAALAYRPGRGVRDARPFLSQAVSNGCTHVAKADVASFFDEIPWEHLQNCVEDFLPAGDRTVRAALEAAWRLAYTSGERKSGLLQGSPVSPLLANLFLAKWDDAMASRGHSHLRYGDDLLIAARSEEDALLALGDASNLLRNFGLRLNPEKNAILSIAEGFRHLGLDLGGEDGDIVETAKPALRRTLYLTKADEWAGIDHGAILVRDGTKMIHRIPLLQVSNVVLLGIGGVSTAFMSACLHRGIPVTIADHSGHHCGTLHAESRQFYALVVAHGRARYGMRTDAALEVARTIVEAKLTGYLGWADSILPPASQILRDSARSGVQSLKGKTEASSFLGIEGAAARKLFRAVNDLCRDPFWHSGSREPHSRKDAWNLLLDTLSFLLFTRVNILVRATGLDPFLGFLHSPSDRFESLVCDIQEPFRARIERLAVRLVNIGILKPAHTEKHPDGSWSWSPDGWRQIIAEFETELDRRRGKDPITWRTQVQHLVEAIRLWALDPERRLSFLPSGLRLPPAKP